MFCLIIFLVSGLITEELLFLEIVYFFRNIYFQQNEDYTTLTFIYKDFENQGWSTYIITGIILYIYDMRVRTCKIYHCFQYSFILRLIHSFSCSKDMKVPKIYLKRPRCAFMTLNDTKSTLIISCVWLASRWLNQLRSKSK